MYFSSVRSEYNLRFTTRKVVDAKCVDLMFVLGVDAKCVDLMFVRGVEWKSMSAHTR